MQKGERGSFTIEAILSLTIFMFAFFAIVSLATIAKVESTTQYAIDQIAKEVAQYYYIAERMGVANTKEDPAEAKKVDDTIDAFLNFTNKSTDVVNNYSGVSTSDFLSGIDVNGIKNDATEVANAAQDVYNNFSTLLEDPVGIVKALASMLAQTVGNELVSRFITQPICKALMPRYITSNGDADETLRKMGVVNGLDGLDFRMSSFLRDKRSINIVLVYQIEVNGFGIFDQTLVIKQTASTAAWVKGQSIKDAAAQASKWEEASVDRGKDFVEEERKSDADKAVKPGIGVDLYDESTNTFTSVNSLNVFCASYSDYNAVNEPENNPENYTLKKDKIKAKAKQYAVKLDNDVDKIDEFITMADGTQCQTAKESVQHRNKSVVLVIPEEAQNVQANKEMLDEIAKEIYEETGVQVTISYRETALGGT